jgi:hypothetical protein
MSLINYIYAMDNCELNNLAKNRFIDHEMQVELANCRHLRARQYLAGNPNLCDRARDILLSGRSNAVKFELVRSGNLNSDPDLIHKVYTEAPRRMLTSFWRLDGTFIGGGWYQSYVATPVETLKAIYLDIIRPAESRGGDSYHDSAGYWGSNLARHHNVSEELAVIMSTSSIDRIKKSAFETLVKIRESNPQEL